MNLETAKLLENTDKTEGAPQGAIDKLLESLGSRLPDEYLDFLRFSNGAAGPVGKNGFVSLYAAEEIPRLNEDYGVSKFAPGLVLIGSNGGGEAFAIDTRNGSPDRMEYVEVPFIPLDLDEIWFRTLSFHELLQYIADSEASDTDYPEPPPIYPAPCP
jgi:hypothetical protein